MNTEPPESILQVTFRFLKKLELFKYLLERFSILEQDIVEYDLDSFVENLTFQRSPQPSESLNPKHRTLIKGRKDLTKTATSYSKRTRKTQAFISTEILTTTFGSK